MRPGNPNKSELRSFCLPCENVGPLSILRLMNETMVRMFLGVQGNVSIHGMHKKDPTNGAREHSKGNLCKIELTKATIGIPRFKGNAK